MKQYKEWYAAAGFVLLAAGLIFSAGWVVLIGCIFLSIAIGYSVANE